MFGLRLLEKPSISDQGAEEFLVTKDYRG